MKYLLLAAEENNLAIDAEETIEALKDIKPGILKQYMLDSLPRLLSFAFTVLLALVFFFIGLKVTKLIRKIIKHSMERSGIDRGVITFTESLTKAICYVLLFLLIIGMFGIQTTSFIAVFGSASLAIGLSLQGALSNFAGGVLILIFKPFSVGDYIVSGSNEGTVTGITMVSTKLLTIDNKAVIIPNGELSNSTITNVNKEGIRRLDLKISISYESDIRTAKDILEKVVSEDDGILKEKEVQVFVDELGESAVILGSRGWVLPADYWSTKWRILENVKYAYDDAGIIIPYNQIDVHVFNNKESYK